MSYNIKGYETADHVWESAPGWNGRDPSKAIETITTVSPDVVGVQEDDSYLNEYVSALNTSYYRLTGNGNGNEYLDIFYKKDKFNECTVTGVVKFKDLATQYDSSVSANGANLRLDEKGRFFRYAVLETKDGIEVLVVNTHLHNGDSDSADAVREYQARLLRAWLDDKAEQYPNQIVMGDLNNTQNAKTLSELTGNGGLIQARDGAIVKGDVGGTLVNNDKNNTSDYFKTRQEWIFDHILYRNVKALGYTVIDNKNDVNNTRYPSDHLPVISEFICYAE